MRRGLLLTATLTACGPIAGDAPNGGSNSGATSTTSDTPTASTTTAGTTTAATTTEPASTATPQTTGPQPPPLPEGCTCEETGGCESSSTPNCGGEQLCPTIRTECAEPRQFYGCIGQDILYDDAALSCALDALSQRTQGWFFLSLEDHAQSSCGLEGCAGTSWSVRLPGQDPIAVVSSCWTQPFTEPDGTLGLRELESPMYFEACKRRPPGQAKLDCLFEGMRNVSALSCP